MSATELTRKPRSVLFTIDEAQRYWEKWRFNCGPSALCAIANRKPLEALAALPQFRQRGYTNPKMMRAGLKAFGMRWAELVSDEETNNLPRVATFPSYGLVRVQFAGPWTKPGVPIVARYRHTHWVGVDNWNVFDINAMCAGGWLPVAEWANDLIPWLIKKCEPKSATGDWWATHCWEVER